MYMCMYIHIYIYIHVYIYIYIYIIKLCGRSGGAPAVARRGGAPRARAPRLPGLQTKQTYFKTISVTLTIPVICNSTSFSNSTK